MVVKTKSLSRAVIFSLFLFHIDVDECKNPNVCPENYRCENLPDSYSCKCDGGYKLTGPRKKCEGKCIMVSAESLSYATRNPIGLQS